MRFDPKGLPVLIAVVLVILNFVVQFFPALGVLATSDLLLHVGVIIGLLGIIVGDAIS
ncbi:MAG: hypothetical protein H5T60_08125 [Anaerolineae bacterium]|jgi:hypothetical protein|nr:hypothetical protein [Anaerolineae bacterium]